VNRLSVKAIVKRRLKVTTDSHDKKAVAPKSLKQKFAMDRINQVWVGGITYIRVNKDIFSCSDRLVFT